MSEGRRITGEGPVPAQIMVIGEAATRDDARTGRPFSPKRYRENELDRFFDGVRLPAREDVYLTTWIKEWCGDDQDNTQADYDRDEPDLDLELRTVVPSLIVALGRTVSRYFLGDVDLDEVHAIQWYLPQTSPARKLFPSPEKVVIHSGYNPAAGFRSPELSSAVAYDFAQLQAYLAGDLQARKLYDDPYPEPHYVEITDVPTLDLVMAAGGTLSADTEGWPWAPWSVQITDRPGHAYILRVAAKVLPPDADAEPCRLVDRFAEWVNGCPDIYTFIFHNSLHDLAVFRALGIDVRRIHFEDTMIQAYNLQLEPQGLKALGTRHCGMQMDSYESIMGDASNRLAQDWLMSALENEDFAHVTYCQAEFDRLISTPYTDKKGKVKPGRKLRVVPKLPKSDLHKSLERCIRSATPRKLWGDQVIDRHIEAGPKYGAMWNATLDHVDPSAAIHYAGRDADATCRLQPLLDARVRAAGLERVYRADLGTVPLIDRMQQVGIRPDLTHFASLSGDLATELVGIQSRLAGQLVAAGAFDAGSAQVFNANSTYQVGPLLYDYFGITSLKNTPGGDESTNDRILEAIEKDHRTPPAARELIGTVRDYRATYKLKHTFVDQIPSFINRWPFDQRIHATFRITRVVSGRLSCSDPNLLAMPKYGRFAVRFREGFISGDDRVFGSWDLSQIELRVLAHLSQDPVLLAAFRSGLDLHARLAVRIFGGKETDHQGKAQTRLAAKAINFGIPMGMTPVGLCVELKKNGVQANEDDAGKWLAETLGLYAAVPVYQQIKIAEARRHGYVTDLCGRRRYVGGIRSFDPGTRSEAERFAFATPIQAGAQEVMKVAEAYAWENVIVKRQDQGQWIEPLIQIHDDLVLECERKIIEDVDLEMVYAMTQTFKGLSVPIETSGDYGENWGHMESIQLKEAA